MLDKIQSYIRDNNMINEGDRIVIGVSGGADSVCLFHVLMELIPIYRISLYVVHINHGIRLEDADKDEEFVKNLCHKNNIPIHSVKVNVSSIAKELGLSVEEAGRMVRYQEFYKVYNENKCNKIAIAHNKNDNAETILFHMFRGTGLKGLSGIPPVRNEIIRPLLNVERDEIESYLSQKDEKFCIDDSNYTDDYSRNIIRNHILKLARDNINGKAIENIYRAGNHIREVNDYLEKKIEDTFSYVVTYNKEYNQYIIPSKTFQNEEKVIKRGIIRKIFYLLSNGLKDIDFLHIELVLSLFEKDVGKSIDLPYNLMAIKDYDNVVITLRDDFLKRNDQKEIKSFEIKVQDFNREYRLPYTNQVLKFRLINYKKNMIIPQNGYTKWFDYDKIKNTVLIRTRLKGDYIEFDATASKKKIKSLFIDDKVPKEKRDYLPLIADGSHIMWVVGGRISEGYKISGDTKLILEISLDGGN